MCVGWVEQKINGGTTETNLEQKREENILKIKEHKVGVTT